MRPPRSLTLFLQLILKRLAPLALGTIAACGGGAPKQPNVLLVVVDTLRADALGSYGSERPTSPEVDALAAKGLRFERAFAHSGWTLPSTMSLLTGLTPNQHRVVRDPQERDRFGRLDPGVETLAESMARQGYATGAIVNNTFLAPEFGFPRGFATYDYVGALRGSHRSAAESVERARAWIEAAPEPWFLVLHVMEPHIEYGATGDAAGRFVSRADAIVEIPFAPLERIQGLMSGTRQLAANELREVRGLYDEEVLSVDQALGPFLNGFDLTRNFVALTSDHGEEFFDLGGFEHGHTLISPVTRVPLIVVGPGVEPAVRSTIVQHADLYQTLLSVAGAPRTVNTSGESLLTIAPGAKRVAISENCLYGSDMLSIVDGEHRFMLQFDTGNAAVWSLDASGMELERIDGAALLLVAPGLAERLELERGNMLPTTPSAGPKIPDEDTFSALKNLGYLGDDR